MKRALLLAVFMMGLCSSMFASWPPPSTDYLIKEWQPSAGERAYGFGQIVYYQGGFYEVMNPEGVSSWGGVEYWNPANLSQYSDDGALCDCETDYQKIAEGKLWEVDMGEIAAGINYIWAGAVYECIVSGDSWGEGFSPTGWNSGSYKKVCNIELAPVDEGCLPDNFVGYFYRASLAWNKGWIGINWETKSAYECVSKTHPYNFETEEGGEWPGTQYGYWAYEPGAWNDPPIPVCEEKDLLTTVDIPDWFECEWPLGAIVKHEGKYFIYNKLDDVIYYPSDQELTIESVLETLPYTAQVPGEGSDWTVYTPASQIKQIFVNPFTYSVQNGCLIINSEAQVSIRLYNLTGQVIGAVTGKSIELPAKGAYIAQISIGGKITVVKVLK